MTTFHTQSSKAYTINIKGPQKQAEMIPALEEACGEKFPLGISFVLRNQVVSLRVCS